MHQLSIIIISIVIVIMMVAVSSTAAEGDGGNGGVIEVNTRSGPVRGYLRRSLFGEREYFAFKGVPYAEPPVDELRFKAPLPKKQWNGTWDAKEFGNICCQVTGLTDERIGVEDCLFLNVYAPKNANTKLSVMFFIHGGGFYEGSGNDDLLGPDFLIDHNVILVTINYRLGVFGFMSLATAEYSGNMGMKDQVLALQWVQENIHQFGGDPESVTIFGHSAGSASVNYHMLSPMSKGLFKRAIMHSGVAINSWAFFQPRDHLLPMAAFSKMMGKRSITRLTELIEFLNEVSAQEILQYIDPRMGSEDLNGATLLSYVPMAEDPAIVSQPFMTKSPSSILESNNYSSNVDTMFGFASHEYLFLMGHHINDPTLLRAMNDNFDIELPLAKFSKYTQTEEYREMLKEIRGFYFGDDEIDERNVDDFMDLQSDIFFTYGIDKMVKIQTSKSSGKTFYYRFSVDGKFNVLKTLFNLADYPGTSHGDELCYIFKCNVLPDLYDDVPADAVEMDVISSLTKMWSNFAKMGHPTPDAEPIDFSPVIDQKVHFLDISNGGLNMAESPNWKAVQFWDELFEKYSKIFIDQPVHDEL